MVCILCVFRSDRVDKPKALSLMLHAADISHPAKDWKLHYRWTQALMEEFFRQALDFPQTCSYTALSPQSHGLVRYRTDCDSVTVFSRGIKRLSWDCLSLLCVIARPQ